ncbi:MAG: YCF48-related protein [Ignavibacteriaceae bacterium]
MLTAVYDPRGAVLNGLFYVIGGLIGSPWTGQKTVQIYNPSTDTWSYGPDLHYGRVGHSADSYNGKILVIGGESEFIPVVNMEVYDPQLNNWEVSDIPDVMNIHCSSLFGTDLYIFGGTKCGITSLCATDDVFSFQLSAWSLQPSGVNNALFDVCFTDANTGTVVGADGIILRTTNSGLTWESQESGTTDWLWDVCFTDANFGIVLGSDLNMTGQLILRTTNGGDTWMSQTSEYWLSDVSFTDAKKGTVVGGDGIILKTTDGGITWVNQSSRTTVNLYDVCFTDVKIGTVVGDSGVILRTTNGGDTWLSQSSGVTEPLVGVSFTDANTGTILGGARDGSGKPVTVLRTIDGGENWRVQFVDAGCDPLGIHFNNSDEGIIVGGTGFGNDHAGTIIHTTDGGESWVKQIIGYPFGFWGVSFADANHGIVVGSHGIILRTTTGGVTWVEENPRINEQIPEYFNLKQNYPNPFNPSTKIRYSVPQTSQIVIKVFDILGNEIETLVNEVKPIGTYELTWNAANLPSGVYFYQLKAGKFVMTKKMILLK